MDSDIVGDGVLQSRTISTGGTSETIARRVHPAKELVPDMYPKARTARTQDPVNAAFTTSVCMF
jgi:hypothetical protein